MLSFRMVELNCYLFHMPKNDHRSISAQLNPQFAGMASWENWNPSWAGPREDVPWPEDARAGEFVEPSREEAGEELYLILIELKVRGILSAKQCCELAYYASMAGAVGGCTELGLRPNRQTGAYSKHFDKVVPDSTSDMAAYYQVKVPTTARADSGRIHSTIPVQLPHEAFVNEFLESSVAIEATRQALSSNSLPPAYREHPVVQNKRPHEIVHPISLYLDGVAFTRTDTLLGIWAYHMLTNQRHLLCVVRKAEMCNCGCRGWDTLYPILDAISWSFKAMAEGRHPAARHDCQAWREEDVARASFANEPLGWKAICLLIKGDWAEYAHSLGFPTHADGQCPCPLCDCTKAEMFSVRNYGPLGLQHRVASLARYEAACAACEINVLVRPEHYNRLRAAMVYDSRPHGFRGRILSQDFPPYGLLKNDRLEPMPLRPDPGSFDVASPPVPTLWWRSSRDSAVRRRNPLFGPRTYITPSCLSIDWLHTFSLGVFQYMLAPLLWALLSANVFSIECHASVLADRGLDRLKELLTDWYAEESRHGRNHTPIQGLTMPMVGTADNPELKLHAAETNGFLHFLSDMVDRFGAALGPRRALWRAGLNELLTMLHIFRTYKSVVPDSVVNTYCEAAKAHMRHCEQLGIRFRPKHHLMLHVGPRSLIISI